MHSVVVSQMRCQLAHLFSKTDIPSALHHQQNLDLVLALRMCGDSWEGGGGGKGQQVVGDAGSKTVYIQRATCSALLQSDVLGTVYV